MKLMVNYGCFLFALLCVFVFYMISTNDSHIDEFYDAYHKKGSINKNNSPIINFIQFSNGSNLLFDYCTLPKLDPWDPVLDKYLNPNYNPKDCEPSYKKLTKVVNNTVVILPEAADLTCAYRCLLSNSGDEMITANWTEFLNNTKPPCDIIQVACSDSAGNIEYKFVHKLIFRNEARLPSAPPKNMPNVHIIVIDSVSRSHFERAMLRTKTFLRNNLKSQPMNYLNKIGINSRPNAFAFLMGKALIDIQASPFSVGYDRDLPCNEDLSKDQFIGFRYQDAGYVTMMAEDWHDTVFSDPSCRGFSKSLADHFLKPFRIIMKEESDYNQNVLDGQCKEYVHHLIDYLQKFIDTYPDRPIFSLTWFTYASHDNTNNVYHTDDYFYKFLQKNERHFQKSYLFFMGDHGMRFGDIRQNVVGEVEDNNPFLWISVPENKRRGKHMDQLRINSEKLISHYDIYATLVGLVNPMNPRIPNSLIHGENLFGPLKDPRTCDRLRIPLEYCICDFKKTKLPQNTLIAVKMATACVDRMNEELYSSNVTRSLCSMLTLNTKAGVEGYRFGENDNLTVYQISWKTVPGDGAFEAFVFYDSTSCEFSIVSTKFSRSNEYGYQARCVNKNPWKSYCYCKDLLRT